MNWAEHCKIGHDQLDQQHKQMLLTVEELLEALNEDEDKEVEAECRRVMDFLKGYVVVHFSTEEMYQEEIGYPDIEHHKQLHKEMTDIVMELEYELIRNHYDRAAVQQVANALTRWWMYHIMLEDKKIVAYANKIKAERETADSEKL